MTTTMAMAHCLYLAWRARKTLGPWGRGYHQGAAFAVRWWLRDNPGERQNFAKEFRAHLRRAQ